MFELNCAARIHRAGITVDVGGSPDLEFMFNGTRWFGECKRPYLVESIEINVGRACEQLGTRLSSSHLAGRGLLAIDISRPLTARAPHLKYDDATELRRSSSEHMGSMVRLMVGRMSDSENAKPFPESGCCLRISSSRPATCVLAFRWVSSTQWAAMFVEAAAAMAKGSERRSRGPLRGSSLS